MIIIHSLRKLTFLLIVLGVSLSYGKPVLPVYPGFSHKIWDELLQRHVGADGRVSYTGFRSDKDRLQAYLDQLAASPPQGDWTREEKMAFWINAYNAFTVKLIVEHYPVSGIRDLHNGKPWDVAWIKLGSKTYTLNNIENDILRPQFKDPRIHFAINCAAKSCPPLLNQAYTAQELDTQLEQQTRAFINNAKFNQISAGKASVSMIFQWYAKDFGDLTAFLNRYSRISIRDGARVTYADYDWSLNK